MYNVCKTAGVNFSQVQFIKVRPLHLKHQVMFDKHVINAY